MIEPDDKVLTATLERWLGSKLPADRVRVVGMKGRTGSGFSAETFYIDVEWQQRGQAQRREFVVRCQNQGSDLFLDASLELPYRVMEAMSGQAGIPVPGVVGLEMDQRVIGVPFLVMQKVPGQVVVQSPNYNVAGWVHDLPVGQRGLVWRNGLDMLARIHRVAWRGDFDFLIDPRRGQPGLDSYLAWVGEWYQWMRSQGAPIALMDLAMDTLRSNKPQNAEVSLLWGDPQPSNILFGEDLSVTSIIDWEMATLGPPEIDLAWWLFFDELFSTGFHIPRLEGLPDRAETIRYYEGQLGRPVADLEYYDLLATFRMAIVGVRAVDRQIKLGRVPADTSARSNQPIMCILARRLRQPEPAVGEDFARFSAAIGM